MESSVVPETITGGNSFNEEENQETLYVQEVDEADIGSTANTHIIHIIQDGDYEEMDEADVYMEEEDDDEEDDDEDTEGQSQGGRKLIPYVPGSGNKELAMLETGRSAKKHGCGEDDCHCAYRSKKALVQHLATSHDVKLAVFEKRYNSVAHILYEFERIQRSANYMFGSDYKTFNSSTKQLRVIYVCAHDRRLRKNRQTGQVCTAFIEFVADYNTGHGTLSGCLQHYKHSGHRDLADYQFVKAEDIPADFILSCPICCEQFQTQAELLHHAFEKIHHIAPRFIRMPKKKELKEAGWENEDSATIVRCDMCTFETTDRSYFMTHRVKAHMGPDCIEKVVAKDRAEANLIFRQAQEALNTRFSLANKRVNDSSIVSYSFRCNFNRRSLTSVCVCSFKMLEFPGGERFEIEIVKAHSHDTSTPCEEEFDDLPPPPDLFTCEVCERVFQNDAILRDHMKSNNHYTDADAENQRKEVVRLKQFFCPVCAVGFTKKLSLRQHQRNFNHDYTPARVRAPISVGQEGEEDPDYEEGGRVKADLEMNSCQLVREKKVIQLFPNLCYDCNQTMTNKVELLKHLSQEHGYDVDYFTREFTDMDHVWKFFYEIQITTKTRYKQHGSQKVDEDNFKIYYICNREGRDRTKKVNRQRSRRKPPKDVNRACTAYFTIRKDHGKILCTGSTTHYGHDIEEEFLLRGKILQKAMEIIQKVPDEPTDDEPVLLASDLPFHSEKREQQRSAKVFDIPWAAPFSDTFAVSPIDGTTVYQVGPIDKPMRIVSQKTSTDEYCSICTAKPTLMKDGQCPHIYQCDCDFYRAGYHNCKHINVLEVYLNQAANQESVLYMTAPCSESDSAYRRRASKVSQLGEDVTKILENLSASEESTKLLKIKMDAIKALLMGIEIIETGTQTVSEPSRSGQVEEVSAPAEVPAEQSNEQSEKVVVPTSPIMRSTASTRRAILIKTHAPVTTTSVMILPKKTRRVNATFEKNESILTASPETTEQESELVQEPSKRIDEASASKRKKLDDEEEAPGKRVSSRPKKPSRRFDS